SAGTQLMEADLLGGGARSARWSQVLTDVLGMPLHQVEGGEHGCALGAARLARAAAGGDNTFSKPHRLRTFEPDSQRVAFYNEAHARWRSLYALATQVPPTPPVASHGLPV
ncbi:MAG: xylulokinase, partial [Comamonadaceae bacterium]|nr:xylulokinase [Comamonadaceae bacterium]